MKNVHQTEFSVRLQKALRDANLTQQELARRLFTSQGTIQGWLTGSMPRKRIWEELATALNVNVRYLFYGEPILQQMADDLKSLAKQAFGESSVVNEPATSPRTSAVNWVPVISWAHAGASTAYEELPLDWQEPVPTVCRSPNAFALIIEGDSMSPRCEPGDVVIVMPNEEPRNGCLVVAKLADDGIVLRRFTRMSNLIRLTAYNPVYPPTDYPASSFHWIYPVHSTVRREWS